MPYDPIVVRADPVRAVDVTPAIQSINPDALRSAIDEFVRQLREYGGLLDAFLQRNRGVVNQVWELLHPEAWKGYNLSGE